MRELLQCLEDVGFQSREVKHFIYSGGRPRGCDRRRGISFCLGAIGFPSFLLEYVRGRESLTGTMTVGQDIVDRQW